MTVSRCMETKKSGFGYSKYPKSIFSMLRQLFFSLSVEVIFKAMRKKNFQEGVLYLLVFRFLACPWQSI